jgi:hypothetical protein
VAIARHAQQGGLVGQLLLGSHDHCGFAAHFGVGVPHERADGVGDEASQRHVGGVAAGRLLRGNAHRQRAGAAAEGRLRDHEQRRVPRGAAPRVAAPAGLQAAAHAPPRAQRPARPQLRKLYEKAKTGQWNGTTDLPWDTDVELDEVVSADQAAFSAGLSPDHYAGTVVEKWGDKEWLEFGIDQRRWTLSQFLHGEQGALLFPAKITETVPCYDAKL